MKFLNSNEIKIFLTCFFIYSLFIHWVGWNEQSRLLPAASLVDKGEIKIDDYAHLTGDRIYYGGHFYSDKAPGTSFLLIPIYSLSKFLTNDLYQPTGENKIFLPQLQFNTTIYIDRYPGPALNLASILGTILLSSLSGALAIVLIYTILKALTNNTRISLITSLLFGFGTMIFSYSTVLMSNILTLSFLLFSFYILYIKKKKSNKDYILGGVLLGLSILIDYLSVFFSFLFLAFLFRKGKSKILHTTLGFLIGIIPLLAYNFIIFNNPFVLSTLYQDPNLAPCVYGDKYFSRCPKEFEEITVDFHFKNLQNVALVTTELLAYPYRGLLFYMPFLLFSFIGFKYLYKRHNGLFYFVIVIFLIYLILNSLYGSWFGGSSFGPRYLLTIIPFFAIPITYFLKYNKNFFFKSAFVLLSLISMFHILLGISGVWEEFIFYPSDKMFQADWYDKIVWSTTIRDLNPLYDHYLPAFLDNGPRSRIFEQSIIGKLPDIRDLQPMPTREIKLFTLAPFGIFVLKVPFLVILILLMIIIFIWKKEVFKLLKADTKD